MRTPAGEAGFSMQLHILFTFDYGQVIFEMISILSESTAKIILRIYLCIFNDFYIKSMSYTLFTWQHTRLNRKRCIHRCLSMDECRIK